MKITLKVMSLLLVVFAFGCSKPTFSELIDRPLASSDTDDGGDKAPSIIWVQVPDDTSVGSTVNIEFDIIPGTSPVVSVVCEVDGAVVPCSHDGDTVVIEDVTSGLHEFDVVVIDENDLQAEEQIDWVVFDNFFKVKQPVNIADEADQVDVVVVVDNTKSMDVERKNMARKIEKFLDPLKGLDWRLGVILTDVRDNFLQKATSGPKVLINGDGQLQKFKNGDYWLSSKLSVNEAKEQFKSVALRRETYGWHKEQGIQMTIRSIEKFNNPKEKLHAQHKAFFREKAALAVIVISDEDESYDDVNYPQFNPAKNGGRLKALIDKTWGQKKLFQFHSIITIPKDRKCRDNSNANKYGTNYAAFSLATGGKIGSVCEDDYSEQLSVIGQDLSKPSTTHTLDCSPLDINSDGKPDVSVSVNGGAAVPSFKIEGRVLTFSSPLKPGDYSINYYCPK